MSAPSTTLSDDDPRRWYEGITRYQWLVLVIASLGWVFDIFEGQIFVASSDDAMPTFIAQEERETGIVLSAEQLQGRKQFYNNSAFAAFLLGGAVGGIVFGMLSDRIGRKRTMTWTIVFYSLFTCLSAFSAQWWQLAGLRFLVAMGVGGEWAVASAMVFEVFPKRSRAQVGSIFHASSILGTWLAIAAATLFIGNAVVGNTLTRWAHSWGITDPILAASVKWRIGFALGALPALLIIWIRTSLKEPDEWRDARQQAASDETRQVGRLSELFGSNLLRNTFVGFTLAAVGMATFWGVHIHGKSLMKTAAQERLAVQEPELSDSDRTTALKRWEMLGMFLVTTGGGLGLILFGSISQFMGRRLAFLLYHIGGFVISLVMFQASFSLSALYLLLPLFGFLTLGMHAGYAIYFPELFPTRLRGTGSGFCFNGGRIAAAPILFLSGWLQNGFVFQSEHLSLSIARIGLNQACSLLSWLYLVGCLVLLIAPETRQRRMAE